MSSSVKIFKTEKSSKPYLQFDFVGDLSEDLASKAIADWRNNMPASTTKINLIYNCNQMTGFETGARRNWQNAMKEFKTQIGEIWVVCDNIFIITGAKTMGLISGFNVKAVRSLEQVN